MSDYKQSPYSPVRRAELDELKRYTRTIAAYQLGLAIGVFILACVVGLLAGWTL